MKKNTKRQTLLSAVLCACLLLSVLSFAACGGRSADSRYLLPDEATAPAAAAPSEATEPEAPTEEITTAAPAANYLDLDGLKVDLALDFVNGIGWILRGNTVTAVTTEGEELFSVRVSKFRYASPFTEGTAFVAYTNDSGKIVEDVYDENGTKLYSTADFSTAGGIVAEHIVAQGEGEYLVLRHEASMTADQWLVGTIAPSGRTLQEFATIEIDADSSILWQINERSLPEWMSDNYRLRDYYGSGTSPLPRYLGDGCYYLPGQDLVYRPRDHALCSFSHHSLLSDVFDGKILTSWNSFYVYDVATGDYERLDPEHTVKEPYRNHNVIDSIPVCGDDMFFFAHDYYSFDGRLAVTVPSEFDGLDVFGSRFYGDYALLVIEGKDSKYYVTVIDKTGTAQFEPFQIEKVSETMTGNGSFAAFSDGQWTVYDHSGKVLRQIGVKKSSDCYLSEGYARFPILETSGGHTYEKQVLYRFDELPAGAGSVSSAG